MKYISTRGGIQPISFSDAVMMGLANDGGLLLPETLPRVDMTRISRWQNLSYQYLAHEILSLFIDDLPGTVLEDLIETLLRHIQASPGHPHHPPRRPLHP